MCVYTLFGLNCVSALLPIHLENPGTTHTVWFERVPRLCCFSLPPCCGFSPSPPGQSGLARTRPSQRTFRCEAGVAVGFAWPSLFDVDRVRRRSDSANQTFGAVINLISPQNRCRQSTTSCNSRPCRSGVREWECIWEGVQSPRWFFKRWLQGFSRPQPPTQPVRH